jgi:ABC-type tungstate transport system permease subunit
MSFLVSGMLLAKLKESYDNADQAGYLQYQSAVTMKNLIDLGEQIVNDYRSFESEIKRVASTKPDKIARVSEQGKTIENFIDKMRRTGP